MRIESWVGVTAVLLLVCCGAIAAEPQQCHRRVLPANVELAHDLERVLERIYDRSPAFRARLLPGIAGLVARVVARAEAPDP